MLISPIFGRWSGVIKQMEMMMTKSFKGGCLCGNIRFTANGDAKNPHTCSCKMCQRHSGSLTQSWIEFSKDQVTWDGAGGQPALWRSSDFSSRSFCPVCGSTIGAIDDDPIIAIVLGTLDSNNKIELKPDSHSYKAVRPRWWKVEIDT